MSLIGSVVCSRLTHVRLKLHVANGLLLNLLVTVDVPIDAVGHLLVALVVVLLLCSGIMVHVKASSHVKMCFFILLVDVSGAHAVTLHHNTWYLHVMVSIELRHMFSG